MEARQLLDLDDGMALLVECHADPVKRRLFGDQLARKRRDLFSNELNIIVPHYHSSRCADNCAYCGYRRTNRDIERIHLDDDSFMKEFELLLDWGYRSFEFVYATDLVYKPPVIGQRIRVAKEAAAKRGVTVNIGVDSQAFDEEGYRCLKEHGMDFLVLWMETYNEVFTQVHPPDTRKGNYAFRVDVPERLIKAGCGKYSLGVLLGLAPWMEDASMLMAHGAYLRETYGYSPYIIGIPKLTPAMGQHLVSDKNLIDDETLTLISWVYKAMFPDTKLFVNSRQSLEHNCEIVAGGGDLFTIDFATFPGDYLRGLSNSPSHQQFETRPYDRQQVVGELKRRQFNPVFAW
jgi:2-iminoacetate synthase